MPRNRMIVKVQEDKDVQSVGRSELLEQLKELYAVVNGNNLEEEERRERMRMILTQKLFELVEAGDVHIKAGSHWHISAATNTIKVIADINGLNKQPLKPIETTLETEITLGWSNKEK